MSGFDEHRGMAAGSWQLATSGWLLDGDCIMEFLFSNEKETQKGRDHWASCQQPVPIRLIFRTHLLNRNDPDRPHQPRSR